MSDKLSTYTVLEVLPSVRSGEACYKVRNKYTKSLFIWKAYDSKNLKPYQLDGALNEVKLINTFDYLHIIKYHETILHSMSNTLYAVTEFSPDLKLSDLIEKCRNDNTTFEESFIWNILYQITVISKSLASVKVNIFRKQINPTSIYVDPDVQIKIDPFYLKTDLKSVEAVHACPNKVCEIGSILYEMCTLSKRSESDMKFTNFPYSEEMQCMVKMLLHKKTTACNLELDAILHHPTVLFNITSESKAIISPTACLASPTLSQDSAFESDDSQFKLNLTSLKTSSVQDLTLFQSPKCNMSDNTDFLETKSINRKNPSSYLDINLSPTLVALDLKIPGYVPPKMSDHVGKWKSRLELYKEPKEVSEQALSHVWMERLAALREREEAVRLKEQAIDTKQRFDEVASKISSDLRKERNSSSRGEIEELPKIMSGITLQTAMNKKVLVAENINPCSKIKPRLSLSDGSVVSGSDRRDSVNKRVYRRSSSVRTRYRKKKTMSYVDMDSSLSADQGDNSFLPTSTKISADLVPRPSSMHNISKRKVHFNPKRNPFADYESISSTTLTFFEIENIDGSYEVPNPMPPPSENIADRIAKFTYLDLEAMTNQKRAMMEQWRKTPPKVNRTTKPNNLSSKVKAAENIKKVNLMNTLVNHVPHNMLESKCSVSSRKSFGGSYSENTYRSISSVSSNTTDSKKPTVSSMKTSVTSLLGNKENATTPAAGKLKRDSKRMSILGFRTPFKFRI